MVPRSCHETNTVLTLNIYSAKDVFIPKSLEEVIAEDLATMGSNDEEENGDNENESDAEDDAENKGDEAANETADGGGQVTSADDASEVEDWDEILADDGTSIIVGLRVYTQSKEPAVIAGRLRCEGGGLCLCGECD